MVAGIGAVVVRGGVELLVEGDARKARSAGSSADSDRFPSGRTHAHGERATGARRAAPPGTLEGVDFFESGAPAAAVAAPPLPAPAPDHTVRTDSDLEGARLSDIAIDDDATDLAEARAGSIAALAISLGALGLSLGGGFLASRGETAPGAILYAAGIPTTLVALSTLVCAARAARGGLLFTLASLTTLAAVAATTALLAVGG